MTTPKIWARIQGRRGWGRLSEQELKGSQLYALGRRLTEGSRIEAKNGAWDNKSGEAPPKLTETRSETTREMTRLDRDKRKTNKNSTRVSWKNDRAKLAWSRRTKKLVAARKTNRARPHQDEKRLAQCRNATRTGQRKNEQVQAAAARSGIYDGAVNWAFFFCIFFFSGCPSLPSLLTRHSSLSRQM